MWGWTCLCRRKRRTMASSPRIAWWVRLKGQAQDLKDVAEAFQMNRICQVDLDSDEQYYLKSDALNPLTDGNDVLTGTRELVARINGAMKAMYSDYKPIRIDGLITLHANGNRGVVIVPETAQMTIRAGRPTISISGSAPTEPHPSDAEKWLELSADDTAVSDALHYLSREPDWFDLYKTYEVVRSAFGKEKEMFARLSSGEDDLKALKEKIKRFTRTSNTVHDIRHARPSGEPPEVPMGLKEASDVIRGLVTRYLRNRTA